MISVTRPRTIDTVLFDLDGTLVDTLADIVREVNRALRTHRLPELSRSEVRDRVGKGGTALVEASARKAATLPDPTVVAEAQRTYLSGYEACPGRESRAYPGAEALLVRLRTAGVRTALCTNKSAGVATALLSALRLDRHFDAVVAGGTGPRPKPAPDQLWHALERTGGTAALMVGDSGYDLRAARAAGIPMAWVLHGYGTPEAGLPPDLEVTAFDGLERTAADAGLQVGGDPS